MQMEAWCLGREERLPISETGPEDDFGDSDRRVFMVTGPCLSLPTFPSLRTGSVDLDPETPAFRSGSATSLVN